MLRPTASGTRTTRPPITAFDRSGDFSLLTWTSKSNRFYSVEIRDDLSPAGSWMEYFSLPLPGMGGVGLYEASGQEFYRVRAHRPLSR